MSATHNTPSYLPYIQLIIACFQTKSLAPVLIIKQCVVLLYVLSHWQEFQMSKQTKEQN